MNNNECFDNLEELEERKYFIFRESDDERNKYGETIYEGGQMVIFKENKKFIPKCVDQNNTEYTVESDKYNIEKGVSLEVERDRAGRILSVTVNLLEQEKNKDYATKYELSVMPSYNPTTNQATIHRMNTESEMKIHLRDGNIIINENEKGNE